jgi:hypothetical protein
MPLEELRLKLDSDGDGTVENTYDIYPVQQVNISSSKDAFSIAPPGLAAADNILLGVGGMQADISITATVWDDGSDRSNGTAASAVTTVAEQNTYLEETMHAPDFSAGWQLDHLTGNAFNDDDVFVENIEITPLSLDSPKWKPVTLRLRRGESV